MSGGTKLTPGLCLSRRVFGAISAISVPPDTHCCCSTSAPPGPSLFPELLIYCSTPFEGSGAHSRNIRATPLNIVPAILLQCAVDCPRRGHPVRDQLPQFYFSQLQLFKHIPQIHHRGLSWKPSSSRRFPTMVSTTTTTIMLTAP